jgi:hypothetical protein
MINIAVIRTPSLNETLRGYLITSYSLLADATKIKAQKTYRITDTINIINKLGKLSRN